MEENWLQNKLYTFSHCQTKKQVISRKNSGGHPRAESVSVQLKQ